MIYLQTTQQYRETIYLGIQTKMRSSGLHYTCNPMKFFFG